MWPRRAPLLSAPRRSVRCSSSRSCETRNPRCWRPCCEQGALSPSCTPRISPELMHPPATSAIAQLLRPAGERDGPPPKLRFAALESPMQPPPVRSRRLTAAAAAAARHRRQELARHCLAALHHGMACGSRLGPDAVRHVRATRRLADALLREGAACDLGACAAFCPCRRAPMTRAGCATDPALLRRVLIACDAVISRLDNASRAAAGGRER